jgi:16S rRNA G1207 methylase RsmC
MNKPNRGFSHYFTEQPKSKPHYGIISTYLRDRRFKFMTASGVFSKNHIDLGTRLLSESMVLPKQGSVLDLGCGYGVVGIAAAAINPSLNVFMVDVNVRAIRLARKNVEINNVENVIAKRGCLYKPVEDVIFDCILSNPPISAGMEIVKAMISEAPAHMAPKASFQMVVKSKIAGKRFCSFFEEAFGNVRVLARGSGYRVLLSEKT